MKKRFVKIFLVIGIIFTTTFNVSGQYYSNLSVYDYSCAVNVGSILKNGHLYVNGMVCDTAPPYLARNIFAEVDTNSGDPLWVKTYAYPGGQSEFWYNAFIETPYNNGFAMAGIGNYTQTALILFYDSTGTVINIAEIQDTTAMGVLARDLIYHQGAFYFLGLRQEMDYDGNILVYKVDTAGNLVWGKSYGIPSLSELGGCLISNGDNIIIGAARSNSNHVPYTIEDQTHTWIFSIDTAGILLDEWLDPDNKSFWPNDMLIAPNGNLVYVGAHRGNYIWSNWNQVLLRGYAAELDLNTGIQAWEWTNDSFSPITYLNDIKDKGTGYVITGTNRQSKGWILITDYLGNIQWNRKYYGMDTIYPNAWSTLMETQIMSNGNLVSVGNSLTFLDQNHQQQYGWVIGTDTTACLTCYLYGEEVYKGNNLNIYPNPTSQYLNVGINDLNGNYQYTIMNMSGEVCTTGNIDPLSSMLNVEDLATGMYILQISWNKEIRNFRFVKN